MLARVEGAVRAIAAYGLLGCGIELPGEPLSDVEWRCLLNQVVEERLTGLLEAAIADRVMPATDAQAEQAHAAQGEATSTVRVLESRLLELVDHLDQAGVNYRVLLGSSIAHLDYPDPALRPSRQVDVLVHPSQFETAVSVLMERGYTRRTGEFPPIFDRRFSNGVSLKTSDDRDIALHHTLAPGLFGLTVDLAELWKHPETFPLGDRELPALPRSCRFISACFNAVLASRTPHLLSLRDVAQLVLHAGLDPEGVRTLCACWAAEAPIAEAITSTWRVLELADEVALSAWAERRRPELWEERALGAYVGDDGRRPAISLAALSLIPGVRNRLAFLRSVLLPIRSALNWQSDGYTRRWRRDARGL